METDQSAAPPRDIDAPRPPPSWTGPLGLVVVLALWAALAARTPTSTYHFAPLIATLVWPILDRDRFGRFGAVVRVVVLSVTAVVATTLVLHFAGWLDGPVFWETEAGLFSSATFEATLFALLAGGGWLFSARRRLR